MAVLTVDRPSPARPLPAVRPEWWERAGQALTGWLQRRPGARLVLTWGLAVLQWVALGLVVVTVVQHEEYRESISIYLQGLALVVAWFLLARTKTVSWRLLSFLFAIAMPTYFLIGRLQIRMAGWVGLDPSASAGAQTGLAAFGEESLRFLPIVLLVLLAPGRARRFAAVDWFLIGFASGMGMALFEDMLRRVMYQNQVPGLGSINVTGVGAAKFGAPDTPQYGWDLLGGQWERSVHQQSFFTFAGLHFSGALVLGGLGVGIGLVRNADTIGARLVAWSLAVGVPLAALWLVICDHVGGNATANAGNAWLENAVPIGTEGVDPPWGTVWTYTHFGRGTGRGAMLVGLFVVALLVDAYRLGRAGPVTDLPAPAGGPDHRPQWIRSPRSVGADLRATTGAARVVTVPMAAFASLMAFGARDLVVPVRAAERDRHKLRAARRMLVGLRSAGFDDDARVHGHDPRAAGRARWRTRLLALLGGAMVAFIGLVVAPRVAEGVGYGLVNVSNMDYMASYLIGLADWWDSLSIGQQLVAGFALAALLALAGLSVPLALGVAGVGTFVAEHGHGLADLTSGPPGSIDRYIATTGPVTMGLDVLDSILTFAPGNFAGAAAGHALGGAIGDMAGDPAAARQAFNDLIADEAGSIKVNPGKWDYFFGRVTSGQHNQARSIQNRTDLERLGFNEAEGGQEKLRQLFEAGESYPEVARHTSQYGVTITRDVPVDGGVIKVKYFYPGGDLTQTPEISTIIPKVFK